MMMARAVSLRNVKMFCKCTAQFTLTQFTKVKPAVREIIKPSFPPFSVMKFRQMRHTDGKDGDESDGQCWWLTVWKDGL